MLDPHCVAKDLNGLKNLGSYFQHNGHRTFHEIRNCISERPCMCDVLVAPDEPTNLSLYNGSITEIQMS
jgi:hypothetical protein